MDIYSTSVGSYSLKHSPGLRTVNLEDLSMSDIKNIRITSVTEILPKCQGEP